jgi:hypothetical protein
VLGHESVANRCLTIRDAWDVGTPEALGIEREGRKVDALAQAGDEGRGKLR